MGRHCAISACCCGCRTSGGCSWCVCCPSSPTASSRSRWPPTWSSPRRSRRPPAAHRLRDGRAAAARTRCSARSPACCSTAGAAARCCCTATCCGPCCRCGTAVLILLQVPDWLFYLSALSVTPSTASCWPGCRPRCPGSSTANGWSMANSLSPTAGTLAATAGGGVAFLVRLVLAAGDGAGRRLGAARRRALPVRRAVRADHGPRRLGPDPRPGTAAPGRAPRWPAPRAGSATGCATWPRRRPAARALAAMTAMRFCYGALMVMLLMLCRYAWAGPADADAGWRCWALAVAAVRAPGSSSPPSSPPGPPRASAPPAGSPCCSAASARAAARRWDCRLTPAPMMRRPSRWGSPPRAPRSPPTPSCRPRSTTPTAAGSSRSTTCCSMSPSSAPPRSPP